MTDAPTRVATPGQTPAGRRILQTASDLFYRRGIGAVGVELIADAAGVTKKTLYDRFGSKAGLVDAYLRARDQRWRKFLTSYVEEHGGDTPRGQLLSSFDALNEWRRSLDPSRGCGFVNASAELTDPHHPGRQAITEQKAWIAGFFAALVGEMGVDQPEQMVRQLVIVFEGACVAQGLGLDDFAEATARDIAVRLLPGA